jgi:hypothetical protein
MFGFVLPLLPFYKLAFRGSTNRASPVFRQLLEGCSCWHVVFWVSNFWVVHVAADAAFPFVHFFILLLIEKVWILINVCCWSWRF